MEEEIKKRNLNIIKRELDTKGYPSMYRIIDELGMADGGMSLQEIASIFGITRERVRQIEESALKKLRHPRVGLRLKFLFNINEEDSNLKFYGKDK